MARFAAVAVLISGALVGATLYVRHLDEPGHSYPKNWDPRVQPFVDFVVAHRGLQFEHPIDVDFLSEADYVDLFAPSAGTGGGAGSDEAFDQYESVLNAEGLVADLGADDTSDHVAQTASLGFYSFDSDKIYVRGSELTAAVEVVLVHELTHALQAQNFDIRLGGDDDLEVRSVVEADAMRMEFEYTSTLPADQQQEANDDNTIDADNQAALDEIPNAVVQQAFAPYDLGPLFVSYFSRQGGNAAVDKLFDRYPSSIELIRPELYDQDLPEESAPVSTPDDADEPSLVATWSMFEALSVFDAWLPWSVVRPVFDGWQGGSIQYYRSAGDGKVCISAAAALDSAERAETYRSIVEQWRDAAGSDAAVTVTGTDVAFNACDRGAAASAPPTQPFATSGQIVIEWLLLDGRNIALPAEVWGGYDQPESADDALRQCAARAMIDDAELADFVFADAADIDAVALSTITARGTADRAGCGLS